LNPSIVSFSEMVTDSLAEVIANPTLTSEQQEVAIAHLYLAAGAPVKSNVEIDTANLSHEASIIQKMSAETNIQLTWPEIRILHLFASEQARRADS
jgi:hypothetical protein